MKKILFTILLSMILIGCSSQTNEVIDNPIEDETPEVIIEPNVTVSFNAVGDNLIHGAIYGDNTYKTAEGLNFNAIYTHMKPYIQNADISYLNQETILGGTEMGLSHYPAFNSPHEIGDAVFETGFDWINHATNHTLDRGATAVFNTLNYWDQHPNVTVSGIARNQEEADRIQIIERKGMKFGVLAYTYGTNGIPVPTGQDYLVNLIDKDKIEADIKKLEPHVDALLVSMHWGSEYNFNYNEEQADLAQFLADLNVDVIIGTHPHVIQPVETIKGRNGNDTLVIYSLGNFLSAQDVNYRMLGGYVSWDMEFNPNDQTKQIKNVVFMPVINHYQNGYRDFKIYPLKDYTDALANQHGLAASQDVSVSYFKNLVDQVIKNAVKIDY